MPDWWCGVPLDDIFEDVLVRRRNDNGQRSAPDDRLVNWHDLFNRAEAEEAIVDGLILPGRWTALVAPAKVGKSTLALHIATKLATGFDPFTGATIEPIRVLYVDGEMGQLDVRERLIALDLTPDDLGLLGYTDNPPKCNTMEGATALVSMVRSVGARLVVLDGLNALIVGAEKDDTPWRDLYEQTIDPLKRDGVAILSNDNMGKDPSLGGRGSSVKMDKTDGIFTLTRTQDGVLLKCTHTRTASLRVEVSLTIVGADGATPITYREGLRSWPADTKKVAAILDRLGVPREFGRDKARAAIKNAGETGIRNDVLAAAIRWRKNLSPTSGTGPFGHPGDSFGDRS
jgi:hypothetical protein